MGVVEDKTTKIDGINYTTTKFAATDGIIIAPMLVALLGEKLMALLFSIGGEGVEALHENPRVIGPILANIGLQIAKRRADGEENPAEVLKDMLQQTTCDAIRIGSTTVKGNVHEHFDTHFAGEYGHLIKVVAWVGSINFMKPSLGSRSEVSPEPAGAESTGESSPPTSGEKST